MSPRVCEDGVARCPWASADPLLCAYHDEEWGRPVGGDRRLFEKLCLEVFQCGLSWRTILQKRAHFRNAFADFDPERVARFGPRDIARLLRNPGIVRHRGKIEAVITNARATVALVQSEGSLARLLWSFEPPPAQRPRRLTWQVVRATTRTAASERMAEALRARGFRFVGPTTCHALMQAMGIVNDHVHGCALREVVERERARFLRP